MDSNIEDLQKEIGRLKEKVAFLKRNTQINTYKLLLECSPDIILQVDADYNIVVVHSPGQLVETLDSNRGVNILQLTPASMNAKLVEVLKKVFETGETIVYETNGEVSGAVRYYLNHVSAIKNEDGEVTFAYFVCRETSIQKLASMQALESEQKLSVLFEGSSQIISLYDKDSKFIWYNKAAYDKNIFLFGKFIQVGMRFGTYLKEEYRAGFNANFQKVLQGEIVTYTREYVYEGKPFFLEIMLQPVYRNAELVGVSLIGNNHTERKEYETRLELANKELIQQNEQLNQYSYIVSNNLRAPIVTMLRLISIFNQIQHNPEAVAEVVAHITKSENHLDTVIKDLNNVLAVSDQKSVMTSVDLNAKFDMVQFLLKNEIEQSKAIIECDFSKYPIVHSIKSYIHHILYNLLSNAVKYSKHDKAPLISIRNYLQGSGLLCIEFSDDGIGVDLGKIKDKIFGFYKRFHSHVEGKGLGLHLIKKQVDALGGSIEVDSVVNHGTTFRVLLPI